MTDVIERPLTDLLSFIVDNRGRTCPTSDSGVPLIATNCIKDDHVYPVYENIRHVDEETYANWFRSHPEPADIVFVCKGSPGRVALVPDPVPFCIAQDMVALRADTDVVDNRYLYYVLKSPETRRKIENMHVGTMIPHFKKGDFNKLLLPIHVDVPVQKAIAEVLSALDDKIAANTKLARLIDDHLEAKYTNTMIVGAIEAPLGEVAEFLNRQRVPLSAKQRDERPGPVPYYGASGMFGTVDEAIFDEHLVLVGEDGSVINDDGTPVTQYIWGPAWVNNHAHVLRGNGISTELLYLAIRRTHVASLVTGAVQPKINMGNLKKLALLLPDSGDIEQLEVVVSAEMALKRSLAEESDRLKNTRDYLLPQLMSGKIRVREAEALVEAAV